jgi:hypothetical protein
MYQLVMPALLTLRRMMAHFRVMAAWPSGPLPRENSLTASDGPSCSQGLGSLNQATCHAMVQQTRDPLCLSATWT